MIFFRRSMEYFVWKSASKWLPMVCERWEQKQNNNDDNKPVLLLIVSEEQFPQRTDNSIIFVSYHRK